MKLDELLMSDDTELRIEISMLPSGAWVGRLLIDNFERDTYQNYTISDASPILDVISKLHKDYKLHPGLLALT